MSTADAVRYLTEHARANAFIQRELSAQAVEDLLRAHAKTLYHTMKKLTPATIAAAVAAYEKTYARAVEVTKPLPRIAGPVVVAFKNEGAVHGQPIGPLIVIDVDAFNAGCRELGIVPNANPLATMRPFGTSIAGEYDLGFRAKCEARACAEWYQTQLVDL